MNLAFKEWSVIVSALGRGLQSIILRKGGISEEEGDFTLRGNKFILFPTLFHQANEMIKPEWNNRLLPNLQSEYYSIPGHVLLKYYAEVVDKKLLTDWDNVKKLDPFHAWNENIIQERFNRWDKSVTLLVIQVYELAKPQLIELKPQYEGCKSWITLDEDIEAEGVPVIYEKIKGTYF